MKGFFVDFTDAHTEQERLGALIKGLAAAMAEETVEAALGASVITDTCPMCLAKQAAIVTALALYSNHAPEGQTYEELHASVLERVNAILPELFAAEKAREAGDNLDLASVPAHPGTGKGH